MQARKDDRVAARNNAKNLALPCLSDSGNWQDRVRTPGLASERDGKANRSWHRLLHILRWLAHHTRRLKAIFPPERVSSKSSEGVAIPSNFPAPLAVSGNPDNPEKNQNIAARDILGRRETDIGFGQGRIDAMPFLHLGVRFDAEPPTRKDIEAVLNKAKDWFRYAPNCWLIYTSKDADTWGKRLEEISGMEDNASFLLCEINLDRNARYGWLSESAWKWIKKERT